MGHLWQEQVHRFSLQYFQSEPTLDFPSPEYLRLQDVQDQIYSRLFGPKSLKCRPPARYRLRIAKELIRHIEDAIDNWDTQVRSSSFTVLVQPQCDGLIWTLQAVSDDLMSAAAALVATSLPPEMTTAQDRSHTTYHLSLCDKIKDPNEGENLFAYPRITILENRGLIAAGGTTGHRTWEAALHLGQFLCTNKSLIVGKRVLDLGTGTGYLAILCAKHLQAAHVTASDGSDDVLNDLIDNLGLNGLQRSTGLAVEKLQWGSGAVRAGHEKRVGGAPLDVVLGADVTYDQQSIPALITTLQELLQLQPNAQVLISAVDRNTESLQKFLEIGRQERLTIERIPFDEVPAKQQSGPFYQSNFAIKLFRVSGAFVGRQLCSSSLDVELNQNVHPKGDNSN
ncbi:hypothetical protein AAL_07872 [Moelleriella libera RCEF 2490]|uniref:Uncharacterized protein n=1 Tax=Moelleriella libera RCEF 2490 TaxID=1081109 RepID=A0A167WSQ1_9HYPO|nr:hypothetical protein AAL_07872 [Moelleriella libera RCEF 2490]